MKVRYFTRSFRFWSLQSEWTIIAPEFVHVYLIDRFIDKKIGTIDRSSNLPNIPKVQSIDYYLQERLNGRLNGIH